MSKEAKIQREGKLKRKGIRLKKAKSAGELKLEKKMKELIRAKEKYKKIAGEFIDLWVTVKRAQRGLK